MFVNMRGICVGLVVLATNIGLNACEIKPDYQLKKEIFLTSCGPLVDAVDVTIPDQAEKEWNDVYKDDVYTNPDKFKQFLSRISNWTAPFGKGESVGNYWYRRTLAQNFFQTSHENTLSYIFVDRYSTIKTEVNLTPKVQNLLVYLAAIDTPTKDDILFNSFYKSIKPDSDAPCQSPYWEELTMKGKEDLVTKEISKIISNEELKEAWKYTNRDSLIKMGLQRIMRSRGILIKKGIPMKNGRKW